MTAGWNTWVSENLTNKKKLGRSMILLTFRCFYVCTSHTDSIAAGRKSTLNLNRERCERMWAIRASSGEIDTLVIRTMKVFGQGIAKSRMRWINDKSASIIDPSNHGGILDVHFSYQLMDDEGKIVVLGTIIARFRSFINTTCNGGAFFRDWKRLPNHIKEYLNRTDISSTGELDRCWGQRLYFSLDNFKIWFGILFLEWQLQASSTRW